MTPSTNTETPTECLASGCESPAWSAGYCKKHYSKEARVTEVSASFCSIMGCERAVIALGLCPSHYQRHRRAARGETATPLAKELRHRTAENDAPPTQVSVKLSEEALGRLERYCRKNGLTTPEALRFFLGKWAADSEGGEVMVKAVRMALKDLPSAAKQPLSPLRLPADLLAALETAVIHASRQGFAGPTGHMGRSTMLRAIVEAYLP